MTTFRKTPVKSEIASDDPFSKYALGYLNERVKNSFYDYVLRRFHDAAEREGLTKAKLARRLGLEPARVTRLLGAPGNWTLDTVSELLVGICREELQPRSRPYLERVTRNHRTIDLLQGLPNAQWKERPLADATLVTSERKIQGAIAAASASAPQTQSPALSNIPG